MTNADLIALYRALADDNDPNQPLASDDQVRAFLLDAEIEAAIRGRLIYRYDSGLHVAVDANTPDATLPAPLYEITHAAYVIGADRYPIALTSVEFLDGDSPDATVHAWNAYDGYAPASAADNWRDATASVPVCAVQTDAALRLVPVPTQSGTLKLEGYCTPTTQVGEPPQIHAAHHNRLVQWVLYRVFSKPDNATADPNRAGQALAEFTNWFGPRPDADMRRTTRHDAPHHVEVFDL